MRSLANQVVRAAWMAAVVVGIVLSLFGDPAGAAEISKVAGELAADVEHATGRKFKAVVGVVQGDDTTIEALCHCHARALLVEGVAVLSTSVDLDTADGRAVLFHELVHGLQWSEGGNATGCAAWLAREAEALRLEQRWRAGHGAQLQPIPTYTCQEK